eukprot:6870317-Prymnesium_polylepis.1
MASARSRTREPRPRLVKYCSSDCSGSSADGCSSASASKLSCISATSSSSSASDARTRVPSLPK